MRKTFTLLIGVAIATVLSVGGASAQPGTYYKKFLINQNFEGIDALPTGWSNPNNNGNDANSASNPASIFARSGGSGLNSGTFQWNTAASGGNQFRGADLRFPSTNSQPDDADFSTATTWNIEFDWNTASATLTHGNALSLILCGSNSSNIRTTTQWYADAILGIFVMGDSIFHYWNQDLAGSPIPDASGNPTDQLMGPAFLAGDYPQFNRVWSGGGVDANKTYEANAATLTSVNFAFNATYHITAELNFATQKVVSLTITDLDDPTNTATITDKPFLAPTTAGSACAIAPEDRIVTDLSLINVGDNRSSNGGNIGSGSGHTTYIDNLDVYVWKESLGKADVTINYVDRIGNTVKQARTVEQQEVGFIYNLLSDDMNNFDDASNWYLFDADATHAANASKGNGENLTIDYQTGSTPNPDNTLTVIFKKELKSTGTYIWNGNASYKWNYLDDNFNVSGGSDISYQPGNEVEFSKTDATNKEISVEGTIELADADITVSAPDYTIGGTGKITTNGSLIINAPVTLANDNHLVVGGAIINTDQAVSIQNALATTKITATVPDITLNLTAGATFNPSISGTGEGTLNMNLVSLSEYSPAVSGFSVINVHQTTQTSLQNSTWRTAWRTILADSAVQVNFYNDVVGNPVPNGIGAQNTSLQKAKLYLGPNTRLVRDYNEASSNGDVLYIGELTGDATSRMEAGFVDGRYFLYNIGGLNTDAVFNGQITSYIKSYAAATDTTSETWTYALNGFGVTKSGTGTWTVNNDFNFPVGSSKGSQVNVSGGQFIINGNILFPVVTTTEGSQINVTGGGLMDINGTVTFASDSAASVINVTDGTLSLHNAIIAPDVNAITLTVGASGILKTGNNSIGAYNVISNGTVEGGGEYSNSFSMTDSASVLKLKVNSFAAGDFEMINAKGDITVKKGTINITVDNAKDGEITIMQSSEGNLDILDNIESGSVKVLVNGEDITANTVDTPIPADKAYVFYFDSEQGILGVKGTFTDLPKISTSKVVKSVEYYNLLGQKVTKNNLGVTLQKITYTDGSVHSEKVYNRLK